MRIAMDELVEGHRAVLAGSLNGRKALARLMELTAAEPEQPEPVFLDFGGVDVATASFLRESVFQFRDTVRGRRSNLYPVVANANPGVLEELRVLLGPRRDVLLLCSLNATGNPYDPYIAGDLDPKQRVTFDLVKKRGETDAGELMRENTDTQPVTQTAWNNRLASLAGSGLVVELSRGRAKRYRPLLVEN